MPERRDSLSLSHTDDPALATRSALIFTHSFSPTVIFPSSQQVSHFVSWDVEKRGDFFFDKSIGVYMLFISVWYASARGRERERIIARDRESCRFRRACSIWLKFAASCVVIHGSGRVFTHAQTTPGFTNAPIFKLDTNREAPERREAPEQRPTSHQLWVSFVTVNSTLIIFDLVTGWPTGEFSWNVGRLSRLA